jgi:small subunit ribosomal protein S8
VGDPGLFYESLICVGSVSENTPLREIFLGSLRPVGNEGALMSMTDPIADMFTIIRNGSKAGFEKVEVPYSRIKHEIVKILKGEGFIKNFKVLAGDNQHRRIQIFLKYDENHKGVIHIQRVSKPGRRVYVDTDHLPSVRGGLGISILSTSKGILTDQMARKYHVGGEVLCYVW